MSSALYDQDNPYASAPRSFGARWRVWCQHEGKRTQVEVPDSGLAKALRAMREVSPGVLVRIVKLP